MKRVKFFAIFAFIVVLLINTGIVNTVAMNTGFSTEELSKEEKENILSNFHITKIATEPQKQGIKCFDVNENGDIALGFESFSNKTIVIYASDGTFKYGYEFSNSGTYCIEWDSNNLTICLVRSSLAVSVTPDGEIKNIVKIRNTTENSRYWNKIMYTREREVNGIKYLIKNDMGIFNIVATSYSQLEIIDTNGNQTIFYDVNTSQIWNTIFILIFIAIFIGIIVFSFIIAIARHKTG